MLADDAPAMADDVRAELEDERFENLQHYSRATYALNCRGPLCRLAETHRGRKRNERKAQEAGRDYKPALEIRKTDREAELAPIIAWHLMERGARLIPPASVAS